MGCGEREGCYSSEGGEELVLYVEKWSNELNVAERSFKPFILNCIKMFESVIMTLTTASLIIRLVHSYLNTNTNTNANINNTHTCTNPNKWTNTTLQTKSRDARKRHRVVGGYVALRASFSEHNRIHCVMLNWALSCVSCLCVIILEILFSVRVRYFLCVHRFVFLPSPLTSFSFVEKKNKGKKHFPVEWTM